MRSSRRNRRGDRLMIDAFRRHRPLAINWPGHVTDFPFSQVGKSHSMKFKRKG